MQSPIYNRKNLPTPVMDVRVSPSPKLSWEQLLSTKREMLQAYEIMKKVLSPVKAIDLRELEQILAFDYYFPSDVIDQLFDFISANETLDVRFDEVAGVRMSSKIYRKQRNGLAVAPSGPFSIYRPDLK